MRGDEGQAGTSLQDALDQLENHVSPRHGDYWGRWKLNGAGDRWSLDIQHYYILLDEIHTNAEMNDWIFQLAGKTWVTAEDLGNLVLAFEDIFEPQANLCGMVLYRAKLHYCDIKPNAPEPEDQRTVTPIWKNRTSALARGLFLISTVFTPLQRENPVTPVRSTLLKSSEHRLIFGPVQGRVNFPLLGDRTITDPIRSPGMVFQRMSRGVFPLRGKGRRILHNRPNQVAHLRDRNLSIRKDCRRLLRQEMVAGRS